MSDYYELHAAQVRARSKQRAELYSTLQYLIKSRTKEGFIDGTATAEGVYFSDRVEIKRDTIRVVFVPKKTEYKYSKPSTIIYFRTYR